MAVGGLIEFFINRIRVRYFTERRVTSTLGKQDDDICAVGPELAVYVCPLLESWHDTDCRFVFVRAFRKAQVAMES